MIEQAYREAEAGGVAVACQDEAGPYQTVPYPGTSWEPQGTGRIPGGNRTSTSAWEP